MVDDVMVEIKMVKEWGFNLGEDACLRSLAHVEGEFAETPEKHLDEGKSDNRDTPREEPVLEHNISDTETTVTTKPIDTAVMSSPQELPEVMTMERSFCRAPQTESGQERPRSFEWLNDDF
ncbi:hypothetical protein L195_g028392 [Trifolium pratense]|uniref:DUF4283 domain protein n=1 Tax=Trifolium pratense TaxID=57577 RepID=A0A2K3L1T1_TRIPR|nr:hypothetical protein L195_g028392 [Trifolium pratense]